MVAELSRLLEDVMANRVRLNPVATPSPNVYYLKWGARSVEVDMSAESITLGGQTYSAENDPSTNQAVISIIGFLRGQLALC